MSKKPGSPRPKRAKANRSKPPARASRAGKAPKRGKAKAASANFLPTRDQVLEFISTYEGTPGKREIARAFRVQGPQRVALKGLLREMEEDGLLERGPRKKFSKPGELPPVGVIEITEQDADGELLARPVNWQSDMAPPTIVLAPAGHKDNASFGIGDRVLARLGKAEEDFDYEARVIKKLGMGAKTVIGVLRAGPGKDWTLEPVDKRERGDYRVANADIGKAQPDDLVEAELLSPTRHGPRAARVVKALSTMDDVHAISLIAIHEQGIPVEFPKEVTAEADAIKPATVRGRTDMRDVPLITIDPADARDHDDAVWAAADDDPKNPGGHQVIVAIADVAGYVRPGSALDGEARKRGNSAYFPDRVVPMLPERISNDLCSLVEGKPRPCIAVRMVFDKDGNKVAHEFMRGLMRSAARLSYQQAQAAYDGKAPDVPAQITEDVIIPLFKAYETVLKAQGKRAPLALDLPERKIEIGEDGHISRIREVERLDSMRLIETFMIAANVCAAESLEAKNAPVVYRVHDAPSPEKLTALSEFLQTLDLNLPRGAVVKPGHINRILTTVSGSETADLVSEVVLRSMAQAEYNPENIGHFGLNLQRYAHFTSPIRRYADLLVHRSLIRALGLGPNIPKDGLTPEEVDRLAQTAEHISGTERRAMMAERSSTDRYLAHYLADRLGSEFEGRISGVTRFGLFVRLKETGADGLVPIASLGGDYYHHSESLHALVGERTGMMYRLGDDVTVRLEEVAPLKGGLRFELLAGGRRADSAERKHARRDTSSSRSGPGGRRGRSPSPRSGRKSGGKPSGRTGKRKLSRPGT
ncbi:ribonuclease R [Pyruvatibacter mobilis]|uniref:Ribonuclease R n=1 Tax=Pyruvatibacter mobilis TaxID=1712261 RepID=A0A845QB36_9HYPH|nr:ribonuclease R [Pyruvatibacter mobilis]NBG95752.1 ribonuclease R [Pyruvatibacter mobilis]QJD74898.1 ribonuclease R [Pyruvatibacter mobilis]GGD11028.1 ribonuclease R [Pyruvatibacter mobilis]